jgi:hypothetical protein
VATAQGGIVEHERETGSVDVLGIIDAKQTDRVLLLEPENPPRRPEDLIARTKCEITFDNGEDLQKCVDALRASDEELKRRPESLRAWEWTITYRESMTIHFGVNWYDRDFFERRKDAFRSDRHVEMFKAFGATPDRFKVDHEVLRPA